MGGTIDFLLNCGSVEVWWLVYSVRKCGVLCAESGGMVTRVEHGSVVVCTHYEKKSVEVLLYCGSMVEFCVAVKCMGV